MAERRRSDGVDRAAEGHIRSKDQLQSLLKRWRIKYLIGACSSSDRLYILSGWAEITFLLKFELEVTLMSKTWIKCLADNICKD